MTRDSDCWRVCVAAAGDSDLSTRDVELGFGTGVVETNLFNAKKILSIGDRPGNGCGIGSYRHISV